MKSNKKIKKQNKRKTKKKQFGGAAGTPKFRCKSPNDVNDSELHFYKLIKEGLEVSDEDADKMFSRMMNINKDVLLKNLQNIPTVTQKIADYIGEEYTDLKTLSKETPEQLRERVPGLSKPAAVAIIKKLSWLSD